MDKDVEFLKNALKGEKVGAISRSSKYVVKKVLKNLEGMKLKKIIEYGPGDGVLTHHLLDLLDKDGKILLVELEPSFVKKLQAIRDERVEVVEGKIEDVSGGLSGYGFEHADLIVTSIPFSLIKPSDRELVVKHSYESLRRAGKLIVFHQYSTLMQKEILKYFEKVETRFEPRNLFPCFIMSAEK